MLNLFLLKMEKQIEIYRKKHACYLKNTREYFEGLSKLEIIFKSAISINANGKMFSHQYRVGKAKTELAANKLLQFEAEILSAQSFEDIFKYTEEVRKMKIGVGYLWSYDTALHIGFNLGVLPKQVYVQSGVKRGIKKFYTQLKIKRKMDKKLFIGLETLKSYEIENFLCVMSKNNNVKNCF